MAEPRLATGIWVSAYLQRLSFELIPVYVVARGDATAGAVLVCLDRLDGTQCLYHQSYDLMADRRVWSVLADGPVADVVGVISRARAADPDLWVIEIESASGTTLLDAPGLEI
ncbi:MAG: DUF1491 family protein [Paracoccaceae bacterium]